MSRDPVDGGPCDAVEPRGVASLRAMTAVALTICLAACTSTGAVRAIQPGATTQLEAGVPAMLPDRSTLVYEGLRSDSRCPSGVQCIHAGSVDVRFHHRQAGQAVPDVVVVRFPGTEGARLDGGWVLVVLDASGGPVARALVRVDPADPTAAGGTAR